MGSRSQALMYLCSENVSLCLRDDDAGGDDDNKGDKGGARGRERVWSSCQDNVAVSALAGKSIARQSTLRGKCKSSR
ncbi:uncharacterized protein SPSK_04728 [Sporothrix schenckii 1099-18]|uniref:Uncharacterized protein n=1 Tax=Sporothrix schenckii 1099-18 TaxID=1397361 RepID=A0A0F2M371_SPOSC|nr:uncharacterized protein SPSK_04728 [Sporothrix schenckii 1099-18]KJR83554.1 hypothetical protein SPSK_04728 [Sporothrix schenckii 1099-18]